MLYKKLSIIWDDNSNYSIIERFKKHCITNNLHENKNDVLWKAFRWPKIG